MVFTNKSVPRKYKLYPLLNNYAFLRGLPMSMTVLISTLHLAE